VPEIPEDADLASRVERRDPVAVARAISLVEGGGLAAAALVGRLSARAGRARRLGITGPPGAGKSTLVAALVSAFRATGHAVGVLAVDPTSPYSGGAVLGDRIRMQRHATDERVFIRSMATRGHLGGVSRATAEAAVVLEAAGFDIVVIETVGVGQAEIDVVRSVDLVVVIVAPGAGDDVQALKAGVLEIGDIFVVNKADQEGADRTVAALEGMLSLDPADGGGHRPQVLRTVATEGVGVEALAAAIDDAFAARGPGRGRRLLAGERAGDALGAAAIDVAAIDHVGVAVRDAGALTAVLAMIGLPAGAPEDLPASGLRVRFLDAGTGDAAMELVETTGPDTPIARFLTSRAIPEAALHHVAFRVQDLPRTLDSLRARGVRLLDEVPRTGAHGARIAFIHPASTSGVLVELVERK
jgi:LAO/AO transport system kinase